MIDGSPHTAPKLGTICVAQFVIAAERFEDAFTELAIEGHGVTLLESPDSG
jgi:hypothetical protein